MTSYEFLCRAQLSREYLYASSTSHESIFGAMAEMVDNARDANATKVEIFPVCNAMQRGGFLLCFLDNGDGMTPSEAGQVITFGKSMKKDVDSQIGHYGTGLKSGSMRLGNDMMLLTKKFNTQTCIFLSRTFLEEEQLDEVIVPIPSFKINSLEPFEANSDADKKKFAMEMEIILKYSPFHSEEELLKQFLRIPQNRGTLVMIFNLKLLVTGEPELDIETDRTDILLRKRDDEMLPEFYSLRHFASILYYPPRMKIYIQNAKIQTIPLTYSLYKPRHYLFATTRFRKQSNQNIRQIEEDIKFTKMKLLEAESKMKQFESQSFASPQDRVLRAKYSKSTIHVSQLKEKIRLNKQTYEMAQKLLKKPKMLKFIFGLNIHNRAMHGIFIYTSGRLIKPYQKLGFQLKEGMAYKGVLGLVNIPFSVLSPTSNKQDFVDEYEFKVLLHSLEDHLLQYWRDSELNKMDLTKLWQTFGYASDDFHSPPSMDPRFVKRRRMETSNYIQCIKCLKWRSIPFTSTLSELSSNWTCMMSSDPSHNACSASEEMWHCPEGKLKILRARRKANVNKKSSEDISLHRVLGTSNLMDPELKTAIKALYSSLAENSDTEDNEPVAKKRNFFAKRASRKKKLIAENQEGATTSSDLLDNLLVDNFQNASMEDTSNLADGPSPQNAASKMFDQEHMKEIVLNYKRCLCYFHNPFWNQGIDQVEELNLDSLSKFPFNELLLSYERHVGSTLRNYQAVIDETKQELEELRFLVSRFLISLDGDLKTENGSLKFNIQTFLKACIEQIEHPE